MFKTIKIIWLICFIASCQSNSSPIIKAVIDSTIKETRLGESNYYIQLQGKFKLSEAHGIEGPLGYDIVPLDSSSTMNGFIEIDKGEPIGGDLASKFPNDTVLTKSYLLNKLVDWKIRRTETGNFLYAYTHEPGNLNAWIYGKTTNEIDSLISIISTLKQKE